MTSDVAKNEGNQTLFIRQRIKISSAFEHFHHVYSVVILINVTKIDAIKWLLNFAY